MILKIRDSTDGTVVNAVEGVISIGRGCLDQIVAVGQVLVMM